MRSFRRPERTKALRQFKDASGDLGDGGDGLTRGSGYTILSYLIAGMLAYGGIGWLIGHFTHVSLLFPIGALVGLAISVGWIIYRYGRPHKLGTPPKGDDR
jgi:F0F1-type ATP synthase assembly protein I